MPAARAMYSRRNSICSLAHGHHSVGADSQKALLEQPERPPREPNFLQSAAIPVEEGVAT